MVGRCISYSNGAFLRGHVSYQGWKNDGLLISGISFFPLGIWILKMAFEEVEDWGDPSPTKMLEIGKRWPISPLDLFLGRRKQPQKSVICGWENHSNLKWNMKWFNVSTRLMWFYMAIWCPELHTDPDLRFPDLYRSSCNAVPLVL